MKYLYQGILWLGICTTGLAQAQGVNAPNTIPPIRQAELLIEQGKSEEAYALLEPLEPELAGNVEYDYFLGVSAVNSGKASRAVFAFERVQATDPTYKDVGLWLSIAYYQSGDRERAKSGFEAVLAQSNNADAKTKAEHYLAAIRREETGAGKAFLRGKVEFGLGHDSNIVNSSPAYMSALQLAAALPQSASNQGGTESILNVEVEGRIPVAGHYAYASLEDDKRLYPSHDVMNSDSMLAKAGMDFTHGGDTYRLGADWRQFSQQGTAYPITGNVNDYSLTGIGGRARFQLSPQDYLGAMFHYNQLRFLANNAEDTNQVLLGANYTHVFRTEGSPTVYVGYANLDDRAVRTKLALNPLYGDGTTVASRNTDIVTLYFHYSISKQVDIFSTGYIYFRRDAGAFARDATVNYGKDRTTYISLGIDWRAWPSWTVRAQLAKTANNSNIALYSYSKTEGIVLFRRDLN